jgi:hypothetical protein
MAKQVIYRRGTTAEHADFVGANGEITVDTVKHVVVVHDGVTAGGVPLANATAVNTSISSLTANAANQAASIIALTANAATQSVAITALQSNAASQQTAINAYTLASNATAIFANIADVRANLLAAHANIELIWGNATVQSEAIAEIKNGVATFGNLIPTQANVYTLGTAAMPWNHLYVGTGSITIGNVTLSDDGGNISIQSSENDFAAFDNIYSISFGARSIGQVGSILFSRSLSDENVRGLAINSPEFFELRSGNIWFGTGGGGNLTVVGNITVDNPGALQFLDSSAASFSVGSISSVGNIGFSDNTYQTTANIMLAAFTMSNHQQWTSNVSTIGAALNQLAARLAAAGF